MIRTMSISTTGSAVSKRDIFGQLSKNKCFDLSVVQKHLISNRLMQAYEVYERFYEIGSLEGSEKPKISSPAVV